MNMDLGAGRTIGPTGSGKLWALTVGINRYRSFPSLQYARQDAEALFHFLQRYRQLAPGRGLLLTDVSPDQPSPLPWALTDTQSTLPNRDNWWSWLQSLCSTDLLQPEDVLWVSFSGYAIHYQNEDYLIPWDGDPKAIVETAVSVRSLLNLLHGARTSKILLILDMSRSQGIFAPEQRPGQQTAQLVTQFGIQTLLSCQPYQFAHESADVRLGLFTAALLEGLRIHHLNTLGEISLYLSDRVPQLCDLHWKPLQIPLGIGSPGFQVYPQSSPQTTQTPRAIAPSSITPIFIPVTTPQGNPDPSEASLTAASPGTALSGNVRNLGLGNISLGNASLGNTTENVPGDTAKPPHLPNVPWPSNRGEGPPSPIANRTPETRIPDPSFTPRFQYGSPQKYPQSLGLATGLAPFLRWFIIAFLLMGGLLVAERLGLRQRLGFPSGLPSGWFQRPQTLPSGVTDQRLLYEPLPRSSPAPADLTAQNQAILREARTLIRDNPASHFSDAIATVRQIQPGEPLYDQAQADIDRWSQTIFDLALGRAQAKDYQAAINAARLVPWDQAQYQDAQTAITYWQDQLTLQEEMNRRLEEATAIVRYDSASSYSDAIGLLRTLPPDHPDYTEAQFLIQEWSLAILDLAEERAAQGNYAQAIEAAQLVPQFTPEEEIARSRIETWSQALEGN